MNVRCVFMVKHSHSHLASVEYQRRVRKVKELSRYRDISSAPLHFGAFYPDVRMRIFEQGRGGVGQRIRVSELRRHGKTVLCRGTVASAADMIA